MLCRKKISNNIFLLIFHLIYFASSKARPESEQSCIRANGNWNSLYERKDLIPDPSTCTSITDNCCHISIKYTYDLLPVQSSYCYSMTGKIEDWAIKFKNYYQDELMWFANFTNDNYESYSQIGNNLNYIYYSNYTCTEMHQREDYSDYDISRCALFNDDGTCKILNDDEYFNTFVDAVYWNVTEGICDEVDGVTGKCEDLESDPDLNNTALEPLLEILKLDYQLDNQTLGMNSQIEKNGDNGNQINWPRPCKPVPLVTVKVSCPPAYSSLAFLEYNLLSIILIFLILFY